MNTCRKLPLYDCVIIGAGPAGSVAALQLARAGLQVLLADAMTFPRPKVCGCCLNVDAWSVASQLGLAERLLREGASPLEGFVLAHQGRRAAIAQELGFALSRERFDAELVEACCEAGVTFLPGTRGTIEPPDTTAHRVVRLTSADGVQHVRARAVIAAGGLASTSSRRRSGSKIGAGTTVSKVPYGYEPGRIYMATHGSGYVGLVAVEGGRFDIAAAFVPEAVRTAKGLGELAGRILESAGLPPVPGIESLNWKGTPRLTHRPRWLARDRVFRVGDAAGYVEPFTGQGIAWAMTGAVGLAEILSKPSALDEAARCEKEWTAQHARLIGKRQWLCRALSEALRWPILRHGLVASMAVAPMMARCVVSRLRVS
jgi:flavin-dependent dehydrogenase